MTAISTLTKYKSPARWQVPYFYKLINNTADGSCWRSSWLDTPDAGAAPTTAAVPTSALAGAITLFNSSGNQFVTKTAAVFASTNGSLLLCDRLSHQGGLSGTAGGAQTTNLPTAALTRYTSGVGVLAAVEIYSNIGVSGVTYTCSYTNSGGTPGQTSQVTQIGGIRRFQGGIIPMPLASGDVGVASVESLTLSGSTGTVGNFGITLYKPLLLLPVLNENTLQEWDGLIGAAAQVPEIVSNACLQWFTMPKGPPGVAVGVGSFNGVFKIDEGS